MIYMKGLVMILDILIAVGLFVYFIVSYLSYNRIIRLIMSHNSLILYHHYFLKSKYEDYGKEPKG